MKNNDQKPKWPIRCFFDDPRPDDVIFQVLPSGVRLTFDPQQLVPEGYEPELIDIEDGMAVVQDSCNLDQTDQE